MARLKTLLVTIGGVVITTVLQYFILLVLKDRSTAFQTLVIFCSDSSVLIIIKFCTIKSPNKMKKFFAKIMAVLAGLMGKLAPELKSAVHTSVVVTEAFKKFVDSPLADLFTILMPGIKDDQIKVLLRQRLPGILMIMRLIESATLLDNEADIVAAAQRYVSELSADDRKPILHELAVRLTLILSDGKITWTEAVQLVEYYYQKEFKPNELKLAA